MLWTLEGLDVEGDRRAIVKVDVDATRHALWARIVDVVRGLEARLGTAHDDAARVLAQEEDTTARRELDAHRLDGSERALAVAPLTGGGGDDIGLRIEGIRRRGHRRAGAAARALTAALHLVVDELAASVLRSD